MRKSAILRITLRSDLCVGSGYSYAGVIDSDVCANENGIPCIPGRRLKGCLREAAELIGEPHIGEIFGFGGMNRESSLRVETAWPENSQALNDELSRLRNSDSRFALDLDAQNVLGCFGRIRTMTEIDPDTGTAKEDSLRYIRVINQYGPRGDGADRPEALCFLAALEFDCEEDRMRRIVRALRHIGLHRNRGLGNVRCELEQVKTLRQEAAIETPEKTLRQETAIEAPEKTLRQEDAIKVPEKTLRQEDAIKVPEKPETAALCTEERQSAGSHSVDCSGKEDKIFLHDSEKDTQWVQMRLTLRNIQPLMLSSVNDGESDSFIRGTALMGALAARYLASPGCTAEDEAFQDMFLKGKIHFPNLCPADAEGNSFAPAPLFLKRLKKTKKLVNTAGNIEEEEPFGEDEDYDPRHGNQPRKLLGKFARFSESLNEVSIMEPEREILYHHSTDGSALLYTFEALKARQYFSGMITGERRYVRLVRALLENPGAGRLRFGKSKSAQYGTCEITGLSEPKPVPAGAVLKKGTALLIALESPGIFLYDNHYTVRYGEVRQLAAQQLFLPTDSERALFAGEKTGQVTGKTQDLEQFVQPEQSLEQLQQPEQNPEQGQSQKQEDPGFENHTALQTETVVGYSAVWNMKKPSCPALSAGSILSCRLAQDAQIRSDCFGERCGEGFGKVRIYVCETDEPEMPVLPVRFSEQKQEGKTWEPEHSRALLENILLAELTDAMKEKIFGMERLEIGPSLLGRVTLMLKESVSEAKEEPEAGFRLFRGKIASIKRENERKKIARFLVQVLCKDMNIPQVGAVDLSGLNPDPHKMLPDTAAELYGKLQTIAGEEKAGKLLRSLWHVYLMQILTWQKYRMKEADA